MATTKVYETQVKVTVNGMATTLTGGEADNVLIALAEHKKIEGLKLFIGKKYVQLCCTDSVEVLDAKVTEATVKEPNFDCADEKMLGIK